MINIPIIEKLRSSFIESHVIVFENDSIDGTKQTLEQWRKNYENVNILTNDYNQVTIPTEYSNGINKYYSYHRISRLAEFRNNYLNAMNNLKIISDFVIVLDLDISNLNLNGIAHSFGLADEWDVVCANGYSYSPALRKRYHDTYALIELGKENADQTEASIYQNHTIWSFLKPGLPLIPVYSAFGGLAIYHYNVLKDKKYLILKNRDKRVEVRCEHFSLCQDIRNSGFTRIYINPNMTLCNHVLTWKVIINFIMRRLKLNHQ